MNTNCTLDPSTVTEVDYFLAGPKGEVTEVVVGVANHPLLGWVVVTAESAKATEWEVERECESEDEAYREAEEIYLCYDERHRLQDDGDW